MTFITILSGGQTGVDRAALDTAISLDISHAGWCPRGRRAEDGRIDSCYRLTETSGDEYEQRTEWNVRDADATLILNTGPLGGGTRLTQAFAEKWNRPYNLVDLESPVSKQECRDWLVQHNVHTLNVAGPRESKQPGIYQQARAYLQTLLLPYAGSSQ